MRESVRERQGSSGAKLLILLLVLGIVTVIGGYLPGVEVKPHSDLKSCRVNMQTIAMAEQAYYVRSMAHEYVIITGKPGKGGKPPTYTYKGAKTGKPVKDFVEKDNPYFPAMPVCPKGGSYVYGVRVAKVGGMTYKDLDGKTQKVPKGGLLISCSYKLGKTGTEHGYFCPGVDSK